MISELLKDPEERKSPEMIRLRTSMRHCVTFYRSQRGDDRNSRGIIHECLIERSGALFR